MCLSTLHACGYVRAFVSMRCMCSHHYSTSERPSIMFLFSKRNNNKTTICDSNSANFRNKNNFSMKINAEFQKAKSLIRKVLNGESL